MKTKLWTGFKDEWLESFKLLEKEELVEVLSLLVEHKNNGSVNISNCSRTVQVVWSTYQAELDRMADISKKRSEAGKRGGDTTQANLSKEEQRLKDNALLTFAKANSSKTNVCYTDKDKDKDKVKVEDIVIVEDSIITTKGISRSQKETIELFDKMFDSI
jgi:hypothetical protein